MWFFFILSYQHFFLFQCYRLIRFLPLGAFWFIFLCCIIIKKKKLAPCDHLFFDDVAENNADILSYDQILMVSPQRHHQLGGNSYLDAMGFLPDTLNCGLRMHRECWKRFTRQWPQRKQHVVDPSMHHGMCVTHVPRCMSRSITGVSGENVSCIQAHAQPASVRIFQEAHCDSLSPYAHLVPSPSVGGTVKWPWVCTSQIITNVYVKVKWWREFLQVHYISSVKLKVHNCEMKMKVANMHPRSSQ